MNYIWRKKLRTAQDLFRLRKNETHTVIRVYDLLNSTKSVRSANELENGVAVEGIVYLFTDGRKLEFPISTRGKLNMAVVCGTIVCLFGCWRFDASTFQNIVDLINTPDIAEPTIPKCYGLFNMEPDVHSYWWTFEIFVSCFNCSWKTLISFVGIIEQWGITSLLAFPWINPTYS